MKIVSKEQKAALYKPQTLFNDFILVPDVLNVDQ